MESLHFLNSKISFYKSQLLSRRDFEELSSFKSLEEFTAYLSSKEPYHSYLLMVEDSDILVKVEKVFQLYLKDRALIVDKYYPKAYENNLKLFFMDSHFNFLKYLIGSKVLEEELMEEFPITEEERVLFEKAKSMPLEKLVFLSPYLSKAYSYVKEEGLTPLELVVSLSHSLDSIFIEEVEKLLPKLSPEVRRFIQDYFDLENAVLSIYYQEVFNENLPIWYPGRLREKLKNPEYARAFLKRFSIEGAPDEMELKVKNLLYIRARSQLSKSLGKPSYPIFYLFSLRGELKVLGRIAKSILMGLEKEFIKEVLM